MEDTYILNVGEHCYEATRAYVNECIRLAKDAMKKQGSKMAIVALEKDKTIIMSKETFIEAELFNNRVKEYTEQGFKVHKIRR